MTDTIDTLDLTGDMPDGKTGEGKPFKQQNPEQNLTAKNKEKFFANVAQKNYDEMLQMIKDGLVDPNVTDSNGKSAFSYLASSLVPVNTLAELSKGVNSSSKMYFLQRRIYRSMQSLVELGAITKIEDLFEIAGKGHWELIHHVTNATDLDVTKKLNGKTLRQMAEEAGYFEVAEYIGQLEEKQMPQFPQKNYRLLIENNELLKENNALLKQILEGQKQDRLERTANMEQTKDLLEFMMCYMDCASSSASSFCRRNEIMNNFRARLNTHHHVRN